MANYPDEEFQSILNSIPTVKKSVSRPKAYSILINGELFVTDAGKTVWKQRNHAMAAFNNKMSHIVVESVRKRLQAQGVDRYSCYRYPEYKTAWADFKQAIISKGILTIIELQ